MPTNPTVVFTARGCVEIGDSDLPKPGDRQVLIRTSRSLISTGTELTVLSGEFPPGSAWANWAVYPFTPGYCNVGTVVEVGPGADRAWLGRRVASSGIHSQYVVSPATGPSRARPVHRDSISDEEAAFFAVAEITMNGVRRAGVRWGDSVVVYGLGLIGQLTARLCRLAGARPVIGVDVSDTRLSLLPNDPAMIRLNPAHDDVMAQIETATRGRKADVVVEATGRQDLIPSEFEALRTQGRFLLLSSPRGVSQFDFHDLCNANSATIIGAHVSSHPGEGELDLPWTRQRHTELFYDLVADGEIQVKPLISHRAPYTGAPELYKMLLQDRSHAMGVILEWPE